MGDDGEEMGWEGGETSWGAIVAGLQGSWEAGSMLRDSGNRSWEETELVGDELEEEVGMEGVGGCWSADGLVVLGVRGIRSRWWRRRWSCTSLSVITSVQMVQVCATSS